MNLDNIQRQLDEGHPVEAKDIQALVDNYPKQKWKAIHWKRRCRLAEKFINKSPCDPDIKIDQWEAYKEWKEFVANPYDIFSEEKPTDD